MQERFEGDGSIKRLELSRPKKDPLLGKCMVHWAKRETWSGRTQSTINGKETEKRRLQLRFIFRKTFLEENELTTENQTDSCLQPNHHEYTACKAHLKLSISVWLKKFFDQTLFSFLPLFLFYLSCWQRRGTKKKMNYFENEPKLILYGGYQMLKLASNTHPRAGDMVSGIKSVNGN